jgi:hypothetical protein
MKRLSIGVILGLACALSLYGQKKADREKDGLTGPISTIETGRIDYSLIEGRTVEGKGVRSQVTSYNGEGQRLERSTFDPKGEILERLVYTYDAGGRNTGYEEYYKAATKPRRHVFLLDDKGNQTEYKVYEADGTLASRFLYKYDDKRNKTEEIFYSWNGIRTGKLVYEYDDRGNQLTQTSYNQDDSISWRTVTSYDGAGRRLQWTQFQNEILRYRIFSKYDDRGRMIEQQTFEFNAPPNIHVTHAPVPGKVIYTYDDDKRTKEVSSYSESGLLKDRIVYSYDDKDNEVGLAAYASVGGMNETVIQFWDNVFDPQSRFRGTLKGKQLSSFEYDAHGNWTRKTYLIQAANSDKPREYRAEYRIITYF